MDKQSQKQPPSSFSVKEGMGGPSNTKASPASAPPTSSSSSSSKTTPERPASSTPPKRGDRAGAPGRRPQSYKPTSFVEGFLKNFNMLGTGIPGKFDTLFSASQDILDVRENFDGLQIIWNRRFNQFFDLAHTILLGSTVDPPSYTFAAGYRKKGIAMIGRFFPSQLATQGRASWTWGKLTTRIIGKATPQPGQSQATLEMDYKDADFYLQGKYHHDQAVEASYTQAITEKLHAGILGFYDLVGGRSGWKGGLKWSSLWGIWAFSYTSVGSLVASYTKSYGRSKRMMLTTDMELVKVEGQDRMEAICAFGFHYNLFQTLIKGRVDSNMRGSIFYEERMGDAISLLCCVEMDWLKDVYKVGLGLSVTGP